MDKVLTTKFKVKTIKEVVEEILKKDLVNLKSKRVLEIGCGDWDFAKQIIEKQNGEWHGFDVIDFKNNLSIVKGSVGDIPYHNNTFDLVVANETVEHWFEYGVTFKQAFGQVRNVLKDNGIFMFNVPIHVHGNLIFLKGDIKKILKKINRDDWEIILVEKAIPSVKVKGWQKIGNSGWKSKVGYPNFFIKNSKDAYSYILNIHLKKKPNVKKIKLKSESSLKRDILVILRFVKTLFLNR